MSDEIDAFEDEEIEPDGMQDGAALAGDESDSHEEAAEAEARTEAVAQADRLLREYDGESDEPPPGPGTDEGMARWTQYLEGVLTEAAQERARVEAVFEAEEYALAADTQADDLEPVDFSTWDSGSFGQLVDRVTGAVPLGTPRRGVGDDEFDRALIRIAEG